jgi:Flp pilus assembly protein TadG
VRINSFRKYQFSGRGCCLQGEGIMVNHRPAKTCASRRGQAIIEMALVVTILLSLSLGLIQFAVLANARMALTNIAREGGRFASLNANAPDKQSGGTTLTADGQIKQYIADVAAQTTLKTIPAGNITISPAMNTTARASGQPITVTINYDLSQKFNFPGMPKFGRNTTSTAVMVIQ